MSTDLMKRSELFFGAVLVPIDFFALLAAGAVAYFLRVSEFVQRVRPAVFEFDLPLAEYMQLVSIVAVIIVAIFASQGLYAMRVTRRWLDEFTNIFSGISIGIMVVIVYMFFSAELFQSRFILLMAYGLGLVFVALGRFFVRDLQRSLLKRGMGVHRVVIAGNGRFAKELMDTFRRRPQLGYRVVAVAPRVRLGFLEELYRTKGIDEIIQSDPTLPEEDNLIVLDFCDQYKIDYKYVPNVLETYAPRVRYRQIGVVPLLELERTPLDGWGRIAKRSIDVILSLLGIIIVSPILLVASIAIRKDTPGPIIYKQIRMGRNMQPFEILKFRSMYTEYCVGAQYGGEKARQKYAELREKGNERTGPLFKMKKDPRITPVGRFIRKWRIDELPQLLNVLKGEMSLFGPRPHLPEEVQRYDKHQRKLFTIKPGVSGMAQVSGNAGLPFDEEAKIDIAYIENWSLRLDAVLLLKTLRILLHDKNAI